MSATHYRAVEASEPVAPPRDRRMAPDRRSSWRGGRRDSDWINRPPGALERLDSLRRRTARLRHFVASLW